MRFYTIEKNILKRIILYISIIKNIFCRYIMSGNDEEEYNIINGEIPAPKPKESYYKHKKGYKLQQT